MSIANGLNKIKMPNRILRDWTTSETIDLLSVHAEVLFTRLIMKADDYGNYTANIKLLKAALFPLKNYSEGEIASWVNECAQAKILRIYTNQGKSYIHIPNFGQRLRAMKSQYPDYVPTDDGHLSDNGRPETKRNEVESETEVETSASSFEENFKDAFDDITCDRYKMVYKDIDLGRELQLFRIKCDNDKKTYYHRDSAGLRTAFQYQLKSANKNGKQNGAFKNEHPAQAAARAFAERVGSKSN